MKYLTILIRLIKKSHFTSKNFVLLFLAFILSYQAHALDINEITDEHELVIRVTEISPGSCKDGFLCGDPDLGLEISAAVSNDYYLTVVLVKVADFEIATLKEKKKIEREFTIKGEDIKKAVNEAISGMMERERKHLEIEPIPALYEVMLMFYLVEFAWDDSDNTTLCRETIYELYSSPLGIELEDSKYDELDRLIPSEYTGAYLIGELTLKDYSKKDVPYSQKVLGSDFQLELPYSSGIPPSEDSSIGSGWDLFPPYSNPPKENKTSPNSSDIGKSVE